MKKDLKCPFCDSSQTRFRIKTKDRRCYSCGEVSTFKKEENFDGS